MFDVRYHALTLVAVFAALAIGLLLGVAIGDEGLVSSAEQRLRQNLSGDVREAREEAERLRDEVGRREGYERATYPALVGDRLEGRRILLIFTAERSDAVFSAVRTALAPSGGELGFVTTVALPLDREALARLAAGTRYEELGEDASLVGQLGERVGRQLATGGRLVRRLRPELLESSSGELGPSEGVVVHRSGDPEGDGESDAFVEGLLRGLRATRTPVVGVEQTTTAPSQIPWYQDHGLATVDNVDHIPGMAALVFALSGAADGHYGEKPTADALLPDALVRP